MGYAARALLLHKVVIGTDNAKRSVKPRSARAPQPDFIFSGSSRTRRLRIPEYLKKNPIIFRKPPARSKKWKEKLLDSECMLKNAGVEKAEVVERLVLSNQKLTGAVISDLKAFSSLKYLDLGDNNVALCHLDQLPALQELHLHCNGISQIQLESGMFPMLRVLGLGYNQLSSDAIQNLTKIPRLEELDLTYNGIIDLPPGMESFLSLKKLSLRRNLIRNESAWLTLANIVHLQVLDISENALRGIPSDFLRRTTGFGSLSFLDISYNFVSAESDLLALAGFVCLEIVDVRGNPLVKASKKDRLKDVYPILYSNLVDPCDMSIIILDPTSESDVEHILRPDHTVNTEGLLEGAKEQVKPPDRDKVLLMVSLKSF